MKIYRGVFIVILFIKSVFSDLNMGLIAHYPMNGNLEDILGGNDAINEGGILAEDRFGNENSAYHLKYYPSNIQIPSETLNGHVDYTLSVWVKAESFEFSNALFSMANSHLQGEIQMVLISSVLVISSESLNDDGFVEYAYDYYLFSGNWQHIILTRDSQKAEYRVYIDGDLFHTAYANQVETQQPLQVDGFYIGQVKSNQQPQQNQQYWQYKGYLSDLRIYGKQFTNDDAFELYENDYWYYLQNFDFQTCIDELVKLKPGTITEQVQFLFNENQNEYFHNYWISFNEFVYDKVCFETQVWIGSKILEHRVQANQIEVEFPWKDAEEWGCEQVSPVQQQCLFQVHIYFKGALQHKKLFTSVINTPDLENITKEAVFNVINDEDESLKKFDQKIATSISFCSDLSCGEYIQPESFIRNQDMFIEFKVDSFGYNRYYPVHRTLTLDNYRVEILNSEQVDNWDQQGRIIYHIRAPFAKEQVNLVIGVSLSKIQGGNRRFLQEISQGQVFMFSSALKQMKDNVGKYIKISMHDLEDLQDSSSTHSSGDDTIYVEQKKFVSEEVLIGLIVFLGLLIIAIFVFIIWYWRKKRSLQYNNVDLVFTSPDSKRIQMHDVMDKRGSAITQICSQKNMDIQGETVIQKLESQKQEQQLPEKEQFQPVLNKQDSEEFQLQKQGQQELAQPETNRQQQDEQQQEQQNQQ